MIEACKLGVKRTRRMLSVNLLKGLKKRIVGTNTFEKIAKILTEENVRNEKVIVEIGKIGMKESEQWH